MVFRWRRDEISKLLSVRFGDTFKFVLLLDGVAVRAALGGVNELISQALGDGLDVTERGLAGSGAQQPDCLQNKFEKSVSSALVTHRFERCFQ